MKDFVLAGLCVVSLVAGEAKDPRALPKGSALRYHVKMRMRGDEALMETNFFLLPTPARRSNNKVQKPRLGGWRFGRA